VGNVEHQTFRAGPFTCLSFRFVARFTPSCSSKLFSTFLVATPPPTPSPTLGPFGATDPPALFVQAEGLPLAFFFCVLFPHLVIVFTLAFFLVNPSSRQLPFLRVFASVDTSPRPFASWTTRDLPGRVCVFLLASLSLGASSSFLMFCSLPFSFHTDSNLMAPPCGPPPFGFCPPVEFTYFFIRSTFTLLPSPPRLLSAIY